MPNSVMHHFVINDTNIELQDSGARTEISNLKSDLNELEDTVQGMLIQGGGGGTCTLTSYRDASNVSLNVGFKNVSSASNLRVVTIKDDNDAISPAVTDFCSLGSGKWMVGFKYKITKVNSSVGDPDHITIILGSDSRTTDSVTYDEWVQFNSVVSIDLTRVYFALASFATAPPAGSIKLEIKDYFVYKVTDVSDGMLQYIANQQTSNYKAGTVTYTLDAPYVPDTTLSNTGKAADSKAVGDAIAEVANGLSTLSSNVSDVEDNLESMGNAVSNICTEKTVTLTDQNIYDNYFVQSNSSWSYVSTTDGVRSFVPKNNASENVYASNTGAYGTGKHLVSFKYRLTKLDQQMGNPERILVILGAGERYYNDSWQYDTWTEFTEITDVDLTRIYFTVIGFPQAPSPTQVKLEVKEMYIYNLADVSNDLYEKIIDAQNESYSSGTVEYDFFVLSDDITGSFSQINVKNYDVKGDGTTDDTEAIRKLFSQKKGNFYFPAGTYKISGTISLPAESTMYGDGDQTIINMYSCSDLYERTFRGGSKVRPYVLVEHANTKLHDFKVTGNNTLQKTDQPHYGVGVIDTNHCDIRNVTVYNINFDVNRNDSESSHASAYGIAALRSNYVNIDHCYVEQCGYECIGIVDYSHYCTVTNCVAINGWRTCIQVHKGCTDVEIIGNKAYQNSAAGWDALFTLHGLSGNDLVRNLRIENNTFNPSVSPRTRLEDYASVIQLMSYGDGLWVVNNRVEDGDRALCADASVTNLVIMGNIFHCSSESDYGIQIESEDAIVIGNTMDNDASAPNNIDSSAVVVGNVGIS